MRLLQAMAGARHGGAEAFFLRLALALQARDLEQRVVIRPHEQRRAALTAAHVPVDEQPFGGWLDWRTRRGLGRLIRDWRPNVVLTWMNRAARACPARDPAARFVHVGRLGGYYDLKYYRRCDHLIGNTPDIVDYLRRAGWPEGRSHYVPNFVSAAPAPATSRADHDTPEGAPLVLALGRLHPNKGFDVLLDALARLPHHWLWLAGAGPLDAALRIQARRLEIGGRVRFLGWREDVAALMAAADVVAVPSRIEPLGNVVIEAWAHGVPVVAATAAGPRQLIEHGVNGLLVPHENAPALADAIAEIGTGDRAAMIEAGAAAHRAEFTEAAVVDRYTRFFDQVAA
ncbi:MAG: glycosyltransferase [Alphaproteobacteria bacterium]|jgi:glycosyltransferase involved in cell wall biosynthesis|nr:glycosyltransferase [Alphaproteobacteria bacterium]MDP6517213.1 glycosyltransferase [Alphaproteobacteria bacterium]